ncbi:HAD family hydrolase [Candidatus Bathyarchaeota archaeon]|nr:HAD family hydrolase [Candidatus Bathyarchaeota archaeon]
MQPRRKTGDMMRGAIFDWDGTLASIDDREFYCINHALTEQGANPISRDFYIDNYYRRAYELGTGPRMVIETALGSRGQMFAEKAYESYRKIFQSSPDKATLQPGAVEILQDLRGERFKIGIATMRYTRSVVEAELRHLGVASHIDILMTRQDLGVRGTLGSLEETVDQRVQLVTREMEKLGLEANDVFLVGDSWWDIKAGRKIGVRTVLVKTGFAAYNDFIEERPDVIVRSLFELRQRLRENDWKP